MTPDASDSERAKVLLVEDDADLRAYLRERLESSYSVLEAADGDAGWRLVQTELPDVVVSDILMPGLDGYALCRAIKADPETDFIPLILLTSKADAQSKLAGLEGGADDYISKPFDPAELLLRIRNLLLARTRLKARFMVTEQVQKEQDASQEAVATDAPAGSRPRLAATPLSLPSSDAGFTARLQEVLGHQSQHVGFDVAVLADQLRMSRSHLHRRISAVLGVSPSQLIIQFRLERAARMLRERAGSVGEVCYAVGFRDLSHFVKRFREHYGQTPAAYARAGKA